ncbi:MAG: hypothetical protein PGN08_01095 [Sphingomonas taxi]
MKRDRRLLFALLCFAITAVAATIEAGIVSSYVYAAVMGEGAKQYFADQFGLGTWPEPNRDCLDFCMPPLPLLPAWIAIGAFALGTGLVILAWWRPRR